MGGRWGRAAPVGAAGWRAGRRAAAAARHPGRGRAAARRRRPTKRWARAALIQHKRTATDRPSPLPRRAAPPRCARATPLGLPTAQPPRPRTGASTPKCTSSGGAEFRFIEDYTTCRVVDIYQSTTRHDSKNAQSTLIAWHAYFANQEGGWAIPRMQPSSLHPNAPTRASSARSARRQRHPNGTRELLAQLDRRFKLPPSWRRTLRPAAAASHAAASGNAAAAAGRDLLAWQAEAAGMFDMSDAASDSEEGFRAPEARDGESGGGAGGGAGEQEYRAWVYLTQVRGTPGFRSLMCFTHVWGRAVVACVHERTACAAGWRKCHLTPALARRHGRAPQEVPASPIKCIRPSIPPAPAPKRCSRCCAMTHRSASGAACAPTQTRSPWASCERAPRGASRYDV